MSENRPLRFLADESCDFSVVRALREAGFDVTAVAEKAASLPDHDVIGLALDEDRILLTEDKDFGQLVFAALAGSGGVVLIRFPTAARSALPTAAVRVVQNVGNQLLSAFVTLSPGRVRISALPSHET